MAHPGSSQSPQPDAKTRNAGWANPRYLPDSYHTFASTERIEMSAFSASIEDRKTDDRQQRFTKSYHRLPACAQLRGPSPIENLTRNYVSFPSILSGSAPWPHGAPRFEPITPARCQNQKCGLGQPALPSGFVSYLRLHRTNRDVSFFCIDRRP
ncbi:hypothetical protein J3R74_000885 [Puniceicoccus vermicola]